MHLGAHVLPVVQHEALGGTQGQGQEIGQVPAAARKRIGSAFLNNHKGFGQLVLLHETSWTVTGRP